MRTLDVSDVDELLSELDDLSSIKHKQHSNIILPALSTQSTGVQNSIRPQAAQVSEQQKYEPVGALQPTLSGVDALLAELQAEHPGAHGHPAVVQASSRNPVTSSSGNVGSISINRLRCSCPHLGGSSSRRGRSNPAQTTPSCCDSLRCTACDFKVLWFTDVRWASGVDYMFFRNSYPTWEKLAAKMQHCPRSCAYCCQCSWVSSNTSTKVAASGAQQTLRWVCAGHST